MVRVFSLFTSDKQQRARDAELYKIEHSPRIKIGSVTIENPCYLGPSITEQPMILDHPRKPKPKRLPKPPAPQSSTKASPHVPQDSHQFFTERPLFTRRTSSSERCQGVGLLSNRTRDHSIKLVAPTPNTRALRRRMRCPRRRHQFSSGVNEFWVIQEENEDGSLGAVDLSMKFAATPIVAACYENPSQDIPGRRVRFSNSVVEVHYTKEPLDWEST